MKFVNAFGLAGLVASGPDPASLVLMGKMTTGKHTAGALLSLLSLASPTRADSSSAEPKRKRSYQIYNPDNDEKGRGESKPETNLRMAGKTTKEEDFFSMSMPFGLCPEETCDDGSCALYGKCPCPEGQEKCYGYCQSAGDTCCDWMNGEGACYDGTCAMMGECPCPEGKETKCHGYCQPTDWPCCSNGEQICYDKAGIPTSCAQPWKCPCPEGQEKCYGHCQSAGYTCCDWMNGESACYDGTCAMYGDCPCPEGMSNTNIYNFCLCKGEHEDTCYNEHFMPAFCAEMGECPCLDGKETKCHGYCQPTDWPCCSDGEEICYDKAGILTSCAQYGKCPYHSDANSPGSVVTKLIKTKGNPNEISYFHHLMTVKEKVGPNNGAPHSSINKHVMAIENRIAMLAQSIKLREANSMFTKEEVPLMQG